MSGIKDPAVQKALAIVEEAKKERGAILAETREQIEAMIAEAASAGQEEGFAQAESLRAEIRQLETRMIGEIKPELVRTALRVAEKILEEEIAKRPDAIIDLTTAALITARDAHEVNIRVHPRHVDIMRENTSRLVDSLGRARDVEIREDRKVAPGGVLIQTEVGVIDAQLETQLEEIALVLEN